MLFRSLLSISGSGTDRAEDPQSCGSVTISVNTKWRCIKVYPTDGTNFTVVGYDSENLVRMAKFDGITGEKLQDVAIRDVDRLTEVM